MELQCPGCRQPIAVADPSQPSCSCPQCGASVEIPQLKDLTCPICCGEFGPEDSLVTCPDCKSVYHAECWEENHGCSTYGCASTHHLETHNSADDAAGAETAAGTAAETAAGAVACPFCGASHAATDLVCPSCGHLLQENARGGGDAMASLSRTLDNVFSAISRALDSGLPKLGRNFTLLFADVGRVFAMFGKAYSHYVDFRGRATRAEYMSFVGVLFLLSLLFVLLRGERLLYCLVWPGSFLPSLALTVRRLRDTGLSPWMVFATPILPLLVLVPTVEDSVHSEVST